MSKEDRGKIRDALLAIHEDGGDWRVYALRSGISEPTAYRWVAESIKSDLRGGRTYSKVSQIHRDFMINEVDKNNRITLAMMKEKLESELKFFLK